MGFFATKDLRHFFKSASVLLKRAERVDLVWVENNFNNVLRNLLFFKIFRDKEITLREKVESFIDLYYNQFLCKKTLEVASKYLEQMQEEVGLKKSGIFDFSKLKYKERDELVESLERWRGLIKNEKFLEEDCVEQRNN